MLCVADLQNSYVAIRLSSFTFVDVLAKNLIECITLLKITLTGAGVFHYPEKLLWLLSYRRRNLFHTAAQVSLLQGLKR